MSSVMAVEGVMPCSIHWRVDRRQSISPEPNCSPLPGSCYSMTKFQGSQLLETRAPMTNSCSFWVILQITPNMLQSLMPMTGHRCPRFTTDTLCGCGQIINTCKPQLSHLKKNDHCNVSAQDEERINEILHIQAYIFCSIIYTDV